MRQETRKSPQEVGLNHLALDQLRSVIEGDMARGLHYGAGVLVARRGEVAFHEMLGTFEREGGRAMGFDDRFLLASTTKAMTAAAALILVDRGHLTLDTRVADIIPEFAVRGKQRVTVYHLLNHTGGTWPYFMPPAPLQWADMGNVDKVIAAVSAQQLTHRPGETVVYNPFADFTILGEIITRVAGKPLRDFARDEIFVPLGMTATSFGMPVGHPNRVPVRIMDTSPGAVEANIMESLNFIDETTARASGGVYSTPLDVFRFAEMLRCDGISNGARILSPAMVRYALQNHTGDRPNLFWDFSKEARDIAEFPANFSLMGGYVRGSGHYLTPLGQFASPNAFGAVGAGSTLFMVDPARELTFVFLAAGLMEGLGHFQRLQRLSDLALAAVA